MGALTSIYRVAGSTTEMARFRGAGIMDGVLLEIRGHHFPGRHWHPDGQPCRNVHVGIQVGRRLHDLVPGDSDSAPWCTGIDVVARDDGPDFRGPAVRGKRGERFVYLADLVSAGVPRQGIVADVDLTDDGGRPRCARLREPALRLAVGRVA